MRTEGPWTVSHLAGRFDRGNFRLRVGCAVVAGGIEHDRQGDFLPKDGGRTGTGFSTSTIIRGRSNSESNTAPGAANGDLVSGAAGDEIVMPLLDALFGDLFRTRKY